MTAPIDIRLTDTAADRVRQSHARAITEMQGLPILGAVVIQNIRLPNSLPVMVEHGIGRTPRFVGVSVIRLLPGAALVASGTVVDFGHVSQAGRPIDRTRMLQIGQFNFGQDLVIDLLLVP